MIGSERLSVVLCSYNGEKFIGNQIDSILRQRKPISEIIVSDDGSTDNTLAVVHQALQHFPGKAIVVTNDTNLGTRKNLNNAVGLCTGDYIFFADQDDVWLPEKTERIFGFFVDNPGIDAVFTDAEVINADDEFVSKSLWETIHFDQSVVGRTSLFTYQIINPAMATGATMAVRKQSLENAMPIFAPQHYWHDYWFGLYYASKGCLAAMNEKLMRFREHAQQQTGTSRKDLEMAKLFHIAWNGPFDKDENGELTAHFAHALTRFELFKQTLVSRNIKVTTLDEAECEIKRRLSLSKQSWFRTMPWFARKAKLLGHWLNGGEFPRISLRDVFTI